MKSDQPTLYEKILLHYIKSFSDNNRSVFQNNKKLSEMIDVSESSIATMISRMVKFGYLSKEMINGNRHLRYTGKPFKQIPLFVDANRAEFAYNKKLVKSLKEENALMRKRIEELTNNQPKNTDGI